MRVNYLPRNKLKHTYFKRILILAAVLASGLMIFSLLDSAIISLVSPVWKAENAFTRSLWSSIAFLNSHRALVEENTVLKEKLSSLEMKVMSLSSKQIQEETLMALISRKDDPETVVAAVLTHPPQTPYDTIIIDAGSNESIALGSQVFLPEGPALGTILEVFPNKAKVKLFSSAGQETDAILERNSVPVVLIGAGGGNFKFTLPRDIAVEEGDKILSADISSRLLAIVGEISLRSTDSFKEVLAKSPANIFNFRFVFVMP